MSPLKRLLTDRYDRRISEVAVAIESMNRLFNAQFSSGGKDSELSEDTVSDLPTGCSLLVDILPNYPKTIQNITEYISHYLKASSEIVKALFTAKSHVEVTRMMRADDRGR